MTVGEFSSYWSYILLDLVDEVILFIVACESCYLISNIAFFMSIFEVIVDVKILL